MQKAVKGTVSRLLVFIGIGGPSLGVIAPRGQGERPSRLPPIVKRRTSLPRSLLSRRSRPFQWTTGLSQSLHHIAYTVPGVLASRRPIQWPLLTPHPPRAGAWTVGWAYRSLFSRCGIGVLVHMFWVLTMLLSRAFRGGPVPIGARFHSCGTRRLVLGCGLEDVD
ncbi:hypothetical protein EDB89DRAFT_174985 [Lactarius sanguifluus]|nr:hypothetical protein EDB89DRAFT_174985 [Lactarius sanguifluus]